MCICSHLYMVPYGVLMYRIVKKMLKMFLTLFYQLIESQRQAREERETKSPKETEVDHIVGLLKVKLMQSPEHLVSEFGMELIKRATEFMQTNFPTTTSSSSATTATSTVSSQQLVC